MAETCPRRTRESYQTTVAVDRSGESEPHPHQRVLRPKPARTASRAASQDGTPRPSARQRTLLEVVGDLSARKRGTDPDKAMARSDQSARPHLRRRVGKKSRAHPPKPGCA